MTRTTTKRQTELEEAGWCRIHELQRRVSKDLELNTPYDWPGDVPMSVGNAELTKVIADLPRVYDDLQEAVPFRGSNNTFYDGHLVAVLSTIIIHRRQGTSLTDTEILGLRILAA